MSRVRIALEIAADLGFDLAGIAPLRPPEGAERFRAWLAAGRHGSMAYLERQSRRILDPRLLQEGARSLLVVGVGHSRGPILLEGGARVARYAAGRDYHNWVGRRLARLAKRLAAEGFDGPFRRIVDAGPLLERSHAAEAGLGFESKSANLLSRRFGPWFFLGELVLDEELAPTGSPSTISCGSCTACLDACPTGAIVEPGVVHSPLCISYLTIEKRGPIPAERREEIGPWVFGCDVCSEVCPFGDKTPDLAERFGRHPALDPEGLGSGAGALTAWLAIGAQFSTLFNGSPMQRPRREGMARNAAIVLGNTPVDGGAPALLAALREDSSPVVREAAAWALVRGYGAEKGVRLAVEAAAAADPDLDAAEGMRRSLAGAP